MTTFMPSITIPQSFFMSPEASTLLPIAVGTALGYSMRRKCCRPKTLPRNVPES